MCKYYVMEPMKSISIYVIHPSVKDANEMIQLFKLEKLLDKYNFIYNKKEPEYVIVSEHIYYKNKYYKELKKYFNKGVVLIYWAGECIAPDMNIFDYAVCWDRDMHLSDRIVRVPPVKEFFSSFVIEDRGDECKQMTRKLNKDKFCCFIYSNPYAHFMRDRIFKKISEYKKVDSLGKHLNNTGTSGTGFSNHHKETTTLKDEYKFSIAAENAVYDGYVSEKLLTSLQAHTVPIYFGSPYVIEEFNEKAFLDVNKFNNLDELLLKVKQIDNSDKLWNDIVSQPWQTEEQLKNDNDRMEKYIEFFDNIFKQEYDECHRIPQGYHPAKYREWFFSSFLFRVEIINLYRIIKGRIMRCINDMKYIFSHNK